MEIQAEPLIHYMAKDNLEFLSLPLPGAGVIGTYVVPFPVHEVLRIEPMAFYMLGKPKNLPF